MMFKPYLLYFQSLMSNRQAMIQMTPHFIVIGNPIAHSKSPEIHLVFAAQAGIDIRYQRQYCPDNADSFNAVIEAFFNGGGGGANVTVPFKQVAYDICLTRGGLSEHAKVAGAVNTLLLKDNALYGDNTDGQGLVNHIMSLGWSLKQARVAIIGAGGAARGVILPLIQAGIGQLTIANRTISKAQTLVAELSAASATINKHVIDTCRMAELTGQFDLIINATSIGLSGELLPLADDLNGHYAYDMMYGRELPFLQHFAARDAQTSDGYGMLIGQAALSFERWTAQSIDVAQATATLKQPSE
jgi:shikimate dehydrogenase